MTAAADVAGAGGASRAREGSPLVWIVLVNWNGWRDTVDCLQSLQDLDYPSYHTIVVDNASTDGSLERLREFDPELDVHPSSANVGFAAGCNIGIEAALEAGAEYAWLLNNDTVVEASSLRTLVEAMEADESIAAAGSKIYYHDRPDVIWYAGAVLTPEGPAQHIGPGEVDAGQYDEQREIDYVTGASMLVRSSVIREVGLMREQYFVYWEEVDWNVRMSDAGYRLVYVPASRIWHKVSSSAPADGGVREIEYLTRNMLWFYRLNRPNRVREVLLNALRRARELRREGQVQLAAAMRRGVWMYVFRRTGRIG